MTTGQINFKSASRCSTMLFLFAITTSSCWAQTYDAASAFERGFTTQSNPNGVWSYGYSSGFTGTVSPYDQTAQPGINGPNAQYWLSSSVNIGESPSAEYNNGPPYDDGNVDFLANEFILVSGIGGQYSDLVFTAPSDGLYSVVTSFRGDQYGIGTVVAVVLNGNVVFSSSVTSEGQTVPFQTIVELTAGDTVVFSVGPIPGGLQNTGLSATVTPITVTTLLTFDSAIGGSPQAGLVEATTGDLYGTAYGGAKGYGTVFKMTTSGMLTDLYEFCTQSGCTDGAAPDAGLVQATNGDFYGTTYFGGVSGDGTIFKMTPSGKLTPLYSFCAKSGCSDGKNPAAGLVQATNGDLYGTTYYGGASGDGTIFKITPHGALITLYSFCAKTGCSDGINPTGLLQATDGHLYGTTVGGGTGNYGTIYKITPSGALTTLHKFKGTDGFAPEAGLIQGTNWDFYGTTYFGGANSSGTVFEMTPGGALTTLYSFCSQIGCADGQYLLAALVQGTDGNLYGTTYQGGANGDGTVFTITPRGNLTTLYSFCAQSGCTDGENPHGALIQATNGSFYGTTSLGGVGGGTVFNLAVGLGPFVETQTSSGLVGASVKILGTDPTGASSVTFNGTPAAFTVNLTGTAISTTVPAGAT
ncbi:MAG: choice-of-anchor tandem repeat GloVer-containing protein, partial [Candidatus Sulfotelmatobacter sp.]